MTDENDVTVAALQEQLAALTAQLEESRKILAPIEDEMVKVNAEEYQLVQSYQESMKIIKERKAKLAEQKYEAQVAINQADYEAKKAAKAIEDAKAAEAAKQAELVKAAKEAEQAAVLEKKFNLVTTGAKWREWAKDHQISAGHYLTENRYVILADPMGLGKTLSSIITADMVEGTTRDASPEHPFLGVEKSVWVPANHYWTQKAEDAASKLDWPFKNTDIAARCSIETYNIAVVNPDESHFITPFDDISPVEPNSWTTEKRYKVKHQGRPVEAGKQAANMPYDLKNKLVDEGYLEFVAGHNETQIVNAVTRPVGKKILYFCPSPLLRNVLEEWREWAPHRNATFIGGMTKAERKFALSFLPKLDDYVIIVNYEAWRRDTAMLDDLISHKFDTIIIDEAHMIKDRKTSAYKGVKQVVEGCKPEYVIPMTGTPILNRPQELFSILTLVNPEMFYEERDFLWSYCEEYYTDSSTPKYKFKPGGLDLLAKKISKNFLRRTKDQAGIQLPEKTITYHELDRDDEGYPEQAKARKHMKEYATIVIDAAAGKTLQATVMIALLTRLRQIETWPAGIIQRDKITKEIILQLDVKESQKIDYIIRKDTESDEWEGLIPDVIEEERVIVFSQFKAPLHELRDRVEAMGYKAAVFDGDTPQALRDEIRLDFDAAKHDGNYKPKYQVLLCNYKAAGVGLNLTGATQLITLDEEWNPGKRDQAWDRIHRIGQTKNVTIHVIRTKDTVDTWLADIISAKEAVVGGFENAMLSTSDFKNALDTGLI